MVGTIVFLMLAFSVCGLNIYLEYQVRHQEVSIKMSHVASAQYYTSCLDSELKQETEVKATDSH